MSKKKNVIPFNWLPASWGLVGPAHAEAKAHYELDGEDLDRRLLEIRHAKDTDEYAIGQLKLDLAYKVIDQYEHDRRLIPIKFKRDSVEHDMAVLKLDKAHNKISDYDYEIGEATILNGGKIEPRIKLKIDKAHGKIAPYEHDLKIAELDFPEPDSLEYQIAVLTADYNHGKIETLEFEKTLATAKNEPWVGIVDNGFDEAEGINGLYFELDWNDQWVAFLKKNGYGGSTDDQIVEQWFSDVCRSQAEETPVAANEPVPFNSGRVINRIRRGDGGGTEYS